MLINARRGEIGATLGGSERCLCLTLGALSQLETAFDVEDLASLGERFSSGRLSANDLITIIHAGLLGGGNVVTRQEVAELDVEGGLTGYADIVRRLLEVTFGTADG